MDGLVVEEHPRKLRIRLEHEYPMSEQWVEQGAWWPGGDQAYILPTAMKAIKRNSGQRGLRGWQGILLGDSRLTIFGSPLTRTKMSSYLGLAKMETCDS